MQEPIESYCRKGIVHFMLFPDCADGSGPVIDTFLQLATDGDLDVIELGQIQDRATRQELAQIARAARIDLVAAAQPRMLRDRLNLAATRDSDRSKALAAMRAELDNAVELGAGTLALMSGFDPDYTQRDAALTQLVRSLQELCRAAEEYGLQILLEPFEREGGSKALLGPTAEAVEVWRQVGCRNFGLLLDLANMARLGERPVRALPLARECLRHVHVGACMFDPSPRPTEPPQPAFRATGPVDGVPQLAEFLRVLLDIGFLNTRSRPVMSFEIQPRPPCSPALALAGAKRSVRTAWLEV
mgnify:CR=1 FL=1